MECSTSPTDCSSASPRGSGSAAGEVIDPLVGSVGTFALGSHSSSVNAYGTPWFAHAGEVRLLSRPDPAWEDLPLRARRVRSVRPYGPGQRSCSSVVAAERRRPTPLGPRLPADGCQEGLAALARHHSAPYQGAAPGSAVVHRHRGVVAFACPAALRACLGGRSLRRPGSPHRACRRRAAASSRCPRGRRCGSATRRGRAGRSHPNPRHLAGIGDDRVLRPVSHGSGPREPGSAKGCATIVLVVELRPADRPPGTGSRGCGSGARPPSCCRSPRPPARRAGGSRDRVHPGFAHAPATSRRRRR